MSPDLLTAVVGPKSRERVHVRARMYGTGGSAGVEVGVADGDGPIHWAALPDDFVLALAQVLPAAVTVAKAHRR